MRTNKEGAQDQTYLLTLNLKCLQVLRKEKTRASIRLARDSFPSTIHRERFVNKTHFKSLKLSDELTRARYEMKDLQSEQTASLFIPQA
jgi:transcriptional regulator of met regulon